MSAPIPSLLLVGTTLIVGWASLWPLRNSLPGPAYHLLAFPVGLLGWTFATATAVLVGTYTVPTAGAGLLLFVAGLRGIIAATVTSHPLDDAPHARQLTGFAVAAVAYASASSLLSLAGITATTADSWKGYWPLGVMIVNQGTFTPYLPSARGFMLPSLSAASLFFGNEWEYVIYPLLAGVLALGLAYVLVRPEPDAARRKLPAVIALATLAFLATDPSFLYHALYVHSHLMSAAYLFFALAGIRLAFDPATGRGGPASPAWLLVAGACTAGLAMTRPDGLAYAFIPVVLAVAVLSDRRRERDDRWAFFAPLLFVLGVPLASAYVEVGLWSAAKLSGPAAAAIYLTIAATAVAPSLLRRFRQRVGLESGAIVWAAVALAVLLVSAAALLRWEIFSLAALNARANLFGANGAYALLWPSLAAVIGVSLLSGDAWRRNQWSSYLLGAIVLFFLIAAAVHGTSHPGRVGTGDSFSRVAFHIVPVAVWFAASVAEQAIRRLRTRASA